MSVTRSHSPSPIPTRRRCSPLSPTESIGGERGRERECQPDQTRRDAAVATAATTPAAAHATAAASVPTPAPTPGPEPPVPAPAPALSRRPRPKPQPSPRGSTLIPSSRLTKARADQDLHLVSCVCFAHRGRIHVTATDGMKLRKITSSTKREASLRAECAASAGRDGPCLCCSRSPLGSRGPTDPAGGGRAEGTGNSQKNNRASDRKHNKHLLYSIRPVPPTYTSKSLQATAEK